MGKGAIPDRWLDYQPLGECISGTKIVAFKVPLKTIICESKLPPNEWFTPSMLLERQPGLKTVIDLTNTHRYYNGDMEFGTKGIDHVKILVEGRGSIPPDSQVQSFFNAIDAHMEKYADVTDALVGVHCTHGLNRTGYFICRWMVDRLNLDPADAIERFNQARGHKIERQLLLDDLKYTSNKPHLPAHEYISPLNDARYEEPSLHSRRHRARPRRDRDRSREDRGRSWRDDIDRRYDDVDRNRSRDNFDRRRRGLNKPSRADLDTNWRAREEEPTDDDDEFRHFGGRHRRPRRKRSRERRGPIS